jgi:hypothetical protein
VLIPPEGNNWGAVIRDKAAEAGFMARVSPLVHPQFETVWRHSPEGSGSRTGVEATLAALRQVGAAFGSLIAVPELYVDLGDRVLVLLRRSGRTVDGIDFDEEGAVVYSFESACSSAWSCTRIASWPSPTRASPRPRRGSAASALERAVSGRRGCRRDS